jgi:hypothetical protein
MKQRAGFQLSSLVLIASLLLTSACATRAQRRETGWWLAAAGVVVASGSLGATAGCSPDTDFCRSMSEGNREVFWLLFGTGVALIITGLVAALGR